MYLLDTNIWLERLLNQKKSEEVSTFLSQTDSRKIAISDFSLHSIAIIMTRLRKQNELLIFVEDLFDNGHLELIHLAPSHLPKTLHAMNTFGLDFDDAYQYQCAKVYNLEFISFDKDFKEVDIKVRSPGEII